MRSCFIGNVASSALALKTLVSLGVDIGCVITKKTSAFNSDHTDLTPLCREYSLDVKYTAGEIDGELLACIRAIKPEFIFCIGWSSILKKEVLESATKGVVGFHPSPLPYGRGRHPLIWALALGLSQTASTFFLIDEGVDSGDIISQSPVAITESDTAQTLMGKVLHTAERQLREFVPQMMRGTLPTRPQEHALATYWRKRGKNDGRIDFRADAENVHNLIRALSSPYPGAHVEFQGKEIKIWEAVPVSDENKFHEPGKVLDVCGTAITVKCGKNAIRLIAHEFSELPAIGGYIL